MTLLAVAVSGLGLVSPDEPVIHADDEALLRGRAAFETIRVYDGRPFRLEQHLERLCGSAERIGLPAVDCDGLRALADEALAAAGEPDVGLRFFWTPGREGANEPVALALVSTLPPSLEAERASGLRLATVETAVSPLLAGVKSTSYAANIAARDDASRRDADDALFLGADRTLLEAPTSNVWFREGRTLLTPTLQLPILAGVTRSVLLELAPRHGYEVEEGVYPLERLLVAEEAFVCSTIREVVGVVEVDGEPIGDGRPGEAARRLLDGLRALVTAELGARV